MARSCSKAVFIQERERRRGKGMWRRKRGERDVEEEEGGKG